MPSRNDVLSVAEAPLGSGAATLFLAAGVAKLRIEEGIDTYTCRWVCGKLQAFREQGIKEIKVYINSQGGSVWDAFEMSNQIAEFEESEAVLGAVCFSAATLVASACRKVTAHANTTYMIHNPRISVELKSSKEAETWGKRLEQVRQGMVLCYLKRAKVSAEELDEMLEAETWMSAEEAREHGFIDTVMDAKESVSPALAASLKDLSKMPKAFMDDLQLHGWQAEPNKACQNNLNVDFFMSEKFLQALGLKAGADEDTVLARINVLVAQAAVSDAALVALGESRGIEAGKVKAWAGRDAGLALEFVLEQPIKGAFEFEQDITASEKAKELDNVRLVDFFASLNPNGEVVKERTWDDHSADELRALGADKPAALEALYAKAFGSRFSASEILKTL